MSSCSEKNHGIKFDFLELEVNKRMFYEGFKFDFYRKCILPKDDYYNFTMVGRSESYKRKVVEGIVKKHRCGSFGGIWLCEKFCSMKYRPNCCWRSGCKICYHKVIERQVKNIGKWFTKIEILEKSKLELAHYSFNIICEPSKKLWEKHFNDGAWESYQEKFKKKLKGFEVKDTAGYKTAKAKLSRLLKFYGFDGIIIGQP